MTASRADALPTTMQQVSDRARAFVQAGRVTLLPMDAEDEITRLMAYVEAIGHRDRCLAWMREMNAVFAAEWAELFGDEIPEPPAEPPEPCPGCHQVHSAADCEGE